MPETSLQSHFFSTQVLFDSRPSIREKNFEFAIVNPFLKVLASLIPSFINPKPNGLKRMEGPLRSQCPAHLLLSYDFTSGKIVSVPIF
jgi:hypothetical protein